MDLIQQTFLNEEFWNFKGAATVSERSMLLAGLPFAVGGAHAYQQEVIDLACQALEASQNATRDSIKHFGEEAERAAATIAAAEQTLEAAVAAREAAEGVEAAKKSALEEEKVNSSNAKVEHETAEADKQRALELQSELESEKEETEGALVILVSFHSLENAKVSGAEQVINVLEKADVEKTLLVSATALLTCERDASKRWGAFDEFTFQELQAVLNERRGGLAQQLTEAERQSHDATSEELGLSAIYDVSLERVHAATEELKAAKAATAAAKHEETAARKELKRQETVRSNFLAEQFVAEERLRTLGVVVEKITELHRAGKAGKDAVASKDVEMEDASAAQVPTLLGC